MPTLKTPNLANPYKSKTFATRAFAFSIIAVTIAVIAACFAVMIWAGQNTVRSDIAHQGQTLQNIAEKNRLQTQAELQLLKTEYQQQNQLLRANQHQIEALMQLTHSGGRQQALSQAAYLVHLANLHLNIGHDALSSERLLKLAKQRIEPLPYPSLFSLKNALTSDIAKLNTVPKLDIPRIIVRLQQLDNNIQQLPIVPKHPIIDASSSSIANQPIDPNLPWYRQVIHRLSGLKDLVTIRKIQQPISALLSPQQQVFMKENMQVKTLQAEWAVLHRNADVYQNSLQTISAWLKQYFHRGTQRSQVLAQIQQLLTVNVQPQLPNISNTLNIVSEDLAINLSPSHKKQAKQLLPKQPKKPETKPTTSNPSVEI